MEHWQTIIITIIGSGGMWTFLTYLIQKRLDKQDRNSTLTQMLLGLGHDRIYYLCEKYIDRWDKHHIGLTPDEYDNLVKYLYEPYKKMNGNGTADRLIQDVKKIPIKASRLNDLKITNIDNVEVQNKGDN